MRPPRGVRLVAGVQVVAVALVAGWFLTGHASAPDSGLAQLDVLLLHERVAGLSAVGGRPTVVVAVSTCPRQAELLLARRGTRRGLPPAYGVVLLDPAGGPGRLADPGGRLTRALALGRALSSCSPGYALLDGAGYVRDRTYDPHLADHADEQRVLLEHL